MSRRRGLAAGAPGDIAEALAAVVRRLAGVPVAVQAGGETQRVRVATTDGVPSLA